MLDQKNTLNKALTRTNLVKLLLVLTIVILAIIVSMNFSMKEIKSFIHQNQEQTILISLLIYVISGIAFLPSIPLTLFIAVLIGPLQAATIATIGNTLTALIQYQIGKALGDVIDFEQKKSKLPFGLNKLPVHSPLFMLTARSVPAGARAYSMVCGAYRVPIPIYLWTTFVMFFINSAVLAFIGVSLLPV